MEFIHQATAQTASAPPPAAAPVRGGSVPKKRYEHTFPVEIDTGESLQIGWDTGEDANIVAERFLSEYPQIPAHQRGDIIQFIHQATSQTPSAPAGRQSGGSVPAAEQISQQDQDAMVRQCMEMGFDEATSRHALVATGWLGVEAAMAKLFE